MAWAGLVVVRLARSKQDWGGRLVWISRDGQVQDSQRSPLGQKGTDTLALNWSRLVRRLVPAGDGKPDLPPMACVSLSLRPEGKPAEAGF